MPKKPTKQLVDEQKSSSSGSDEMEELPSKVETLVGGVDSVDKLVDLVLLKLEKKLQREHVAPHIAKKGDKEEQEFGSDFEEHSTVEVESVTLNKRSANEAAVLEKIISLSIVEGERSAKKQLIDIQLVARRRLLILELAQKWGWGIAASYAELFPQDYRVDSESLLKAASYTDMMAKAAVKRKKVDSFYKRMDPEKYGSSVKKVEKPKFGACFRCGSVDHWAKDCDKPKTFKKSE